MNCLCNPFVFNLINEAKHLLRKSNFKADGNKLTLDTIEGEFYKTASHRNCIDYAMSN